MSRVHRDRHGLYVRAGGYLFRPQLNRHSWDLAHRTDLQPNPIAEGEDVKARHMAGTTWGRVGGNIWFSHGCYIGPKGKLLASAMCWDPVEP